MFVVPGQPAHGNEREESTNRTPKVHEPATAPESGNSRTPKAKRHDRPGKGGDCPPSPR